jgi:hypothetical protein
MHNEGGYLQEEEEEEEEEVCRDPMPLNNDPVTHKSITTSMKCSPRPTRTTKNATRNAS